MIFHLLASLWLFMPPAHARDYDTYRSDYYKGAFCTAIGGACAADDDLVTGIFQNPANLATGEERWDFDGDYASRDILEAGAKGNNGAADSIAAGGIAWSPGNWGTGIGFTWRRSDIDTPSSIPAPSGTSNTRLHGRSYTTQLRLPVAYYLGDGVSVGATISYTTQHQELEVDDPNLRAGSAAPSSKLRFSIGTRFPLSEKIRFGSWFRFPITLSDHIAFTTAGSGVTTYREDFSLHSPWIWGNGAAWTVSNALTLYAEADLIGPTVNGYLLSYASFSVSPGASPRPEKGQQLALEPHAGARYALSDRAKLHFGSYYENSRWSNAQGRLHGTFGFSHKVWIFELIAGIDAARDYSQIFFTFR